MRLSLSCLRSRIILQFQHEEKNNFIVCIENMRRLFVVDHSLFLFLARSLASNQPFCVEEFDKRARARSQKKRTLFKSMYACLCGLIVISNHRQRAINARPRAHIHTIT